VVLLLQCLRSEGQRGHKVSLGNLDLCDCTLKANRQGSICMYTLYHICTIIYDHYAPPLNGLELVGAVDTPKLFALFCRWFGLEVDGF
jgi:hypothetical protein